MLGSRDYRAYGCRDIIPRPGLLLIIAAAHARALRSPCNGGNGKLIGKLQYPKKKRNQHKFHALHGMREQLPRRGQPLVFHGPAYTL